MMKIISARHEVEEVHYEWQFQFKEDPYFNGHSFNGGYSFTVDKEGRIVSEDHRKTVELIKNNGRYIDMGIKELHRTYMEPAVGLCVHCGSEVTLDGNYLGASDCPKCGKWYGMNGEEFTDPDKWEGLNYEY